jgi:hypothetical protein
MAPLPIHEIYQLPDDAFTQIIRDVELLKNGCRLHYMVDSHEIIDYCFPIEPSGYSDRTPDQIADDQAALYEVFYNRNLRPILIPDYEAEVRRHLAYLDITAQRAYDGLDLVRVLLGDSSVETIKGLTKNEILERMETEFNVLLAAAMGIYSIGVERFKELVSTRIQRIDDMSEPFVKEAHASYRATGLVRAIRDDLVRPLDQKLESQSLVSAEMKRRTRAAETDASAVDWLIHLNKTAETQYGTQLKDRPVFVYLSSAQRTKRIFSSPPMRKIKLRVAGEPYSIQRNRTQLLALLVCREQPGETGNWHERTVENLKELRSLSGKIRQLEALGPMDTRCTDCALGGGTPKDCQYIDVCNEVVRREELRARIPNLGLLGELPRYSQLIQSKPRDKSQEWCRKVFSDLMATENIGDLAIAKMKTILNIGSADASLSTAPQPANVPDSSRQPPDMAFLPLPPVVGWPEHVKLVAEIFSTPWRLSENPSQSNQILVSIADAFEVLDRRVGRGDVGPGFSTGEHEVVRCLVYMTHGFDRHERDKGDMMALEYAEKMLVKYPELTPEFNYIIIWTARRLGRFWQAHSSANRSLELRPNDPRFYHGRSVNTICWLADKIAQRIRPKDADVESAIADASRAIELYLTLPNPPIRVISLQYNNIAWLRCRDWQSKEYNLAEARRMMDSLRWTFPETEWLPSFPEYFHTKAFVAAEEFRAARAELRGKALDGRRAWLLQKLEEADEALHKALSVRKADEYVALARHIENERRALAKGALRKVTDVSQLSDSMPS